MKLLANTHWWRGNDARPEGGDEYASDYDVQLTLTFTMRPIYPVKTGKVNPDERLDSREGVTSYSGRKL